jgi:hypothetical protein
VRLDAERKLSPDLGLAFFTGEHGWVHYPERLGGGAHLRGLQ